MKARSPAHRRAVVVLVAACCVASDAGGQPPPARTAPRVQPELRADFIDARAAAAHVGVGLSVPTSTYVRVAIVGAVGQAWSNGEASAAGRVDGLVRFVVDPLREFRWGPYASGGVGAIYDGAEQWRAVLVGVLGVEGPPSGRLIPAFEVGFGGGVRIGVALRRAIAGRR